MLKLYLWLSAAMFALLAVIHISSIPAGIRKAYVAEVLIRIVFSAMFACMTVAALVLLSGCGGGSPVDPEPQPRSTASAGDAHAGSPTLVLALPGPPLELAEPARVRVRISGTLQQTAHYAAQASVAIALESPVSTGASVVPVALGARAVQVPLAYDVTLQLPAGTHDMVARVVVRSSDADGLSTAALAVSYVVLDWTVEVLP